MIHSRSFLLPFLLFFLFIIHKNLFLLYDPLRSLAPACMLSLFVMCQAKERWRKMLAGVECWHFSFFPGERASESSPLLPSDIKKLSPHKWHNKSLAPAIKMSELQFIRGQFILINVIHIYEREWSECGKRRCEVSFE